MRRNIFKIFFICLLIFLIGSFDQALAEVNLLEAKVRKTTSGDLLYKYSIEYEFDGLDAVYLPEIGELPATGRINFFSPVSKIDFASKTGKVIASVKAPESERVLLSSESSILDFPTLEDFGYSYNTEVLVEVDDRDSYKRQPLVFQLEGISSEVDENVGENKFLLEINQSDMTKVSNPYSSLSSKSIVSLRYIPKSNREKISKSNREEISLVEGSKALIDKLGLVDYIAVNSLASAIGVASFSVIGNSILDIGNRYIGRYDEPVISPDFTRIIPWRHTSNFLVTTFDILNRLDLNYKVTNEQDISSCTTDYFFLQNLPRNIEGKVAFFLKYPYKDFFEQIDLSSSDDHKDTNISNMYQLMMYVKEKRISTKEWRRATNKNVISEAKKMRNKLIKMLKDAGEET